MKILIAGDSHTGAVRQALAQWQVQGREPADCEINVIPLGSGAKFAGKFFTDEGARLVVQREANGDIVLPVPGEHYDWYGLCGPLHINRVFRHEDWVRYATKAMPAAEIPLSVSAMRRVVRDDQKYLVEFIKAMKRTGMQVFVMEPPRLFRHHRKVLALGAEKLQAIDSFCRDLICSDLAALGVPVIRAPASTLDADGFTLDEFRAQRDGDLHHGNVRFGTVMLEEVLLFARQQKQAAG